MTRKPLAVLLILHGLAHASIGVWGAGDGPIVLVTILWGLAMVGYLAAGLGMLGAPILRSHWTLILVVATVASIALLTFHGRMFAAVGIPLGLTFLLVSLDLDRREVEAGVAVADGAGLARRRHRWLRGLAWTMATLGLVYVAAVVAIRPVYLRWGATTNELTAVLPGDDRIPNARYRVDHAITIHAPADSVWPWLVQLGQDRAGFYSYSKLERLVGDRIQNADRIHPEWQRLAVGDIVRATQPDYLGGRLGQLGWRVGDVVPGRAIVLEGWGAFVLRPVDSSTTRFIVRTRGPGTPNILAFLLGPLNVFVMEPAHFIMQRGMLRGIRERAEHRAGT